MSGRRARAVAVDEAIVESTHARLECGGRIDCALLLALERFDLRVALALLHVGFDTTALDLDLLVGAARELAAVLVHGWIGAALRLVGNAAARAVGVRSVAAGQVRLGGGATALGRGLETGA